VFDKRATKRAKRVGEGVGGDRVERVWVTHKEGLTWARATGHVPSTVKRNHDILVEMLCDPLRRLCVGEERGEVVS
jgi:hypothetical protein